MIGSVVNERYEIVSELGEGGMATVYRAIDRRLQREVALKILHPHIAKHDEFRMRFQQEAAIAARLVHPNIVQIHDYGVSEDGRTFIVSELIRGKDFHHLQVERMKETGRPFAPLFCAMVCEEILKALEAAHSQSFVHRDVKPDNVMIAEDGLVKLTDFGIAKNISTSMTVAGHFLGSPVYSSPEQVQAKEVDFRSDLYAVGIILYEAVTGRLPFTGQNAPEVMLKIAQGHYTSPDEVIANLPEEIVSIIRQAMQTDKDKRFNSTGTMIKAIKRYLQARGVDNGRAGLEAYFADPERFMAAHSESIIPAAEQPRSGSQSKSKPEPSSPRKTELPDRRADRDPSSPRTPDKRDQDLIDTVPNLPKRSKQSSSSSARNSGSNRRTHPKGSSDRTTRKTATPLTPSQGKWFVGVVAALVVSVVLAILAVAMWDLPGQQGHTLQKQLPSMRTVAPAHIPTELPTPSISFNSTREPVRIVTPRPTPEPTTAPILEPKRTAVAKSPTERRPPKDNSRMVAMVVTPRSFQPSPMPTVAIGPRPTQPPATGRVTLQSIPSGAQVFVDDRLAGNTGSDARGKSFEVKSGPHTIRVSAPDHLGTRFGDVEKRVYVDPGRTLSLGLVRLVPYRTLTISITGPGVIVRVNGDPYPLQGKPLTLNLPEGKVEIRARAANGKTLERTLQLKGENFTLNAALE